MRPTSGSSGTENVPENWDQLRDDYVDEEGSPAPAAEEPGPATPPVLVLVGSAWGDLVTVLGVCTAALATLNLLGYGAGWAAAPWAAAVGVVWWLASASVLLVVRNATPGMLMAGVAFVSQVPGDRGIWTLLAALMTWITFGLPALVGADRSPVRLAAGVGLVCLSRRDTLISG